MDVRAGTASNVSNRGVGAEFGVFDGETGCLTGNLTTPGPVAPSGLSMVHSGLDVGVIAHGPTMFHEERQDQVSVPELAGVQAAKFREGSHPVSRMVTS